MIWDIAVYNDGIHGHRSLEKKRTVDETIFFTPRFNEAFAVCSLDGMIWTRLMHDLQMEGTAVQG